MTSSLVVGPLQAYRYWHARWHEGKPVLQSLYSPTIWPPDAPLQAMCENSPGALAGWVRRLLLRPAAIHPAPTWGCGCGIYGLLRLEGEEYPELWPHMYQRGLFRHSVHVFGAVLLWGRVIQHEQGYRAEYGRPVKLLTDPALLCGREMKSLLDAVAQRYALELVSEVGDLTYPLRSA
jgi:hypothetical protein